LRARIRTLERTSVSLAFPPVPGAPRPACSPSPLGSLHASGLHEIKAAAYRDSPAAIAFALAVIAAGSAREDRAPAPVLWCHTEQMEREWGSPYAPGLLGLGLDPALFLIVEAPKARAAAWALEEGLKSRALGAAVGQVEALPPLAARRLGLAAKAGQTPCLLLSGPGEAVLPGILTRWRVAGRASALASFDRRAPGALRWHLMLERSLGIAPEQSWTVEWCDASRGFRLAAPVAPREVEAGESGSWQRAVAE
jgi:hypothetical protein